ncbi:MAG: hypothetical protein GY811_11620 [Myxococcales bacterium]|nr:hypothetical protein [Myxococcales bacterium]
MGSSVDFESEIAPIIERDCGTSVCHAATDEQFLELPENYYAFPVDSDGKLTGADRLEAARVRTLEKLASEDVKFSDFIRKPLDESLGGSAHRGGAQYASVQDDSLVKLMQWGQRVKPAELPEISTRAERYAAEIEPILAEKRCMLSSCHGASAANLLIFDPGVVGEFDINSSKQNYTKVAVHMNFATPDAMMSRLIRKAIPLDQGGIFHRGGNDFFDPSTDDEDLQTIVDFIADGRTELGDDDKGVVTGMVFASTDPTPRRIFDISAWQPGGEIHSLIPATAGGTLANLTAAHHTGPADIRDPAVSYDATKVAFSMRRTEDDCLNIYVMNIDGSNLRQVTNDTGTLPNGIKISNVEPVWGPDNRIYFISTRAGELSSHDDWPLSNAYLMNEDGTGITRMSFNGGNEVAPGWRYAPHHGEEEIEIRTLDLTFTATRKVGNDLFAPLMRVPPDFHADYHPHYGTQNPEYQIFTQMTQMPDMREPLLLMDDSTVWEGGALALVDRNLGAAITDDGTPSVVNYVDPLQEVSAIGEVISHQGASVNGYYRDPFSMPDGSIIVAHSSASIDLTNVAAAPDTGIYHVSLKELAGNNTIIDSKELLVDIPGKIEMDPRPIFKRRLEEVGDPLHHLENGAESGTLLNFDLAVLLTVGDEDSPSSKKTFDEMAEDIDRIRFVEEIQRQPGEAPGRGGHGIRRIIAEFDATEDRSLYVELPAGVPFYMQALDEDGMASSTFNQWYFILPGEKLNQVTRREVWDSRCGGCHGSRSGIPGDTVGTPDVLSQASRVDANYDKTTRTDLPPVPYGLDPNDRQEIDFARDIQPIFTASCATAGCHDGSRAPDLTARAGNAGFSGAYEALTATGAGSTNNFVYVDPISTAAQNNYLTEVLLQRELSAPREMDSGQCPGGNQLGDEQKRLIMTWMDLGANFEGIGSKVKPTLPTF